MISKQSQKIKMKIYLIKLKNQRIILKIKKKIKMNFQLTKIL